MRDLRAFNTQNLHCLRAQQVLHQLTNCRILQQLFSFRQEPDKTFQIVGSSDKKVTLFVFSKNCRWRINTSKFRVFSLVVGNVFSDAATWRRFHYQTLQEWVARILSYQASSMSFRRPSSGPEVFWGRRLMERFRGSPLGQSHTRLKKLPRKLSNRNSSHCTKPA